MLIVCTSDSHGRLDTLKKIQVLHPNADLYLDAGDSERSLEELEPFLTVKGNCDYKIETKYRIINAEGIKIYIFHGDKSLLTHEVLAQKAKDNDCDMIIHGHTHVAHHTIYNGIHILCPGSVTFPRTRMGCTYAIIKINNREIEVEIKKVLR